MKIAISYPPIVNDDGQKAMVSQNRNVQFFKKPTYLLPVVHGQAATWLKNLGYKIYWDDGNSQLKTFDQWYLDLLSENPDVIVFESTTPVMKFYWRLIKKLKSDLPRITIIMTGYHSMRKPEETLRESPTDIILQSNHVDFVLKKLIPYIDENVNWRYPSDVFDSYLKILDNFELTRSSEFTFGDPTNHNFYFWKKSKFFHDVNFFRDFDHQKIIKIHKSDQNL